MKRSIIFLLALAPVAWASQRPIIRWPAESVALDVSFDVKSHTVEGIARLTLARKGEKTAGFLLNKNFQVTGATIGGEPFAPVKRDAFLPAVVSPNYGLYGRWDSTAAALWTAPISKSAAKQEPLVLEVRFKGSLYSSPDNRQFSRDVIAQEVAGTIGEEGIYLSPAAYWYPVVPDCQTTHQVTAQLPAGWNCVTDGLPQPPNELPDGRVEIAYTSEQKTVDFSFTAGPYVIKTVTEGNTLVATYFLPGEAGLADDYLNASRRFIRKYSELISPYPFPRFAIVDNFLPSGYGMPGWTLIGSEVLQLPFIKDISLGHEILHNWFGNSLLVDYRQGNWCEGLTIFLADYRYKEEADSNSAMEYRMNLLRDYSDYVTADKAYPPASFNERSDQADRAIGYGKVMMIFYMLRQMLDQLAPGTFQSVLNEVYTQHQWQAIGWDVWQHEFERRLGQRLDWFFTEWVQQADAPKIALQNVRVTDDRNGGWEATMELTTVPGRQMPYNYLLKVRGVSDRSTVDYPVFIREPTQAVSISGPGQLENIVLDPRFEVFRTLYPGEAPVTLANFFGDTGGVLIIPSQGVNAQAWRQVADGLKSKGQRVITDREYVPADGGNSLWILGDPDENAVWNLFPNDSGRLSALPLIPARWKEEQPISAGLVLAGESFRGGALTATSAALHPSNPVKCIVHTVCLPAADPVAGTRKLSHYGKYSYLLFDGDTNTRKGVWAVSGDSPMSWRRGK